MNVITVFLNTLLKELIYVKQFRDYEIDNLVYQLLRALYDLKQAPRKWYHTIRDFLIFKEFKTIELDHFIFVNERTHLIMSVYVNNIQILDPKESRHITDLKKELQKKFAMTDLDSCLYYLDMKI